MQKLRTEISKAFWCSHKTDGGASIEPAIKPRTREEEINWFDELLEGGFVLPKQDSKQKRAVTILLSGPPGSGKSTFALELAYRCSQLEKKEAMHTLYVTSESSAEWLQEKAISLGWFEAERFIHKTTKQEHRHPGGAHVDILETDQFKYYLEDIDRRSPIGTVIHGIAGILHLGPRVGQDTYNMVAEKKDDVVIKRILGINEPGILIIDSLNTVDKSQRQELFNRFTELTSSGPKIILIVLDTSDSQSEFDFCAYMADTIIRLDRKYITDYMIRTIEIVKARYQPHVWGIHQLKIYGPAKFDSKDKYELIKRAHPFRREGGIFIFPSIHYYLSTYKRLSPEIPAIHDPTKMKNLNKILKGGFPKGRCVGFMGGRGGHKSHLGYQHLLHKVIDKDERGIVISLRDDEGTAKKTMQTILLQDFKLQDIEKCEPVLDEFLREDKLDILYYPPGYITPEEFFHRLFMAIQRMKHNNPKNSITLLFNSLDQLGSRFPLCAKEAIFIPGIIETLTAESITSIFIGVEEPGQPPEQYGLLSMADLILSFKQQWFPKDQYLGHIEESLADKTKKVFNIGNDKLGSIVPAVVMSVVRYTGGQAAGAGGILELVDKKDANFKIYGREGLHFVPFSPKYQQGSHTRDIS
jgi:KaiC/GvpD/RAD55 family RecA-like ATPase